MNSKMKPKQVDKKTMTMPLTNYIVKGYDSEEEDNTETSLLMSALQTPTRETNFASDSSTCSGPPVTKNDSLGADLMISFFRKKVILLPKSYIQVGNNHCAYHLMR